MTPSTPAPAGLSTLIAYLENDFANLFTLASLEQVARIVSTFDFGSVSPTALGSTQITARDGAGTVFDLRGSNFGPITSISDVERAFEDFSTAVALLDGSATATVETLTVSGGDGQTYLKVDFSDTLWTLASEANTLEITGRLPTSLSQIEAGISDLFDLTTGTVTPVGAFDPAISVLRDFEIDSVSIRESGTEHARLDFGDSTIALSAGGYSATLTGDLPDTFAEIADAALRLGYDAESAGYSLDALKIADPDGAAILDLAFESVDLADIPLLTNLVDKIESPLAGGGSETPTGLPEAQRIALLYEAGLDRDGNIDLDGLNFWIDVRESGISEHEIAFEFLGSDEFRFSFGDYTLMNTRELVETFYRNVLNRDGEVAGVDFWQETAASPEFDEADLLLAFADSPENRQEAVFLEQMSETEPGYWGFA